MQITTLDADGCGLAGKLMASTLAKNWRVIPLPKGELNLGKTLQSGQQFTWRKIECDGDTGIQGAGADVAWRGVLAETVWTLKQEGNDGNLLYMIHGPRQDGKIGSKRKRRDGTDLKCPRLSKKGAGYQGNFYAVVSHKELDMHS